MLGQLAYLEVSNARKSNSILEASSKNHVRRIQYQVILTSQHKRKHSGLLTQLGWGAPRPLDAHLRVPLHWWLLPWGQFTI